MVKKKSNPSRFFCFFLNGTVAVTPTPKSGTWPKFSLASPPTQWQTPSESLRLWNDGDRTWAKSVRDTEGEVLLVSQFTLMHVLKGNKPDFHNAMGPDAAAELFNRLVELMAAQYRPTHVKAGAFRQYMKVAIENDGPVTLVVDSPERTPPPSPTTPATDGTVDGGP
eukprot:EG_transcript_26133